MQTDTTTGPVAEARRTINTALDDIRRHTEVIEQMCARNTKRADDITAVITRLREGATSFETEGGLNKMSMAALMVSTEAGDIVDRCIQIKEAYCKAGMAMVAFEKAALPPVAARARPRVTAEQRDLVQNFHDGKISSGAWQQAAAFDPALEDLLADYRQFLGVTP